SDRGGVEVDETLATRAPLVGIPVTGESGGGCTWLSAEASTDEGLVVPCIGPQTKDVTTPFTPPASRYDAFAAAEIVSKDGSVKQVVAARDPSGKLKAKRGDAQLVLEGVGAQIAIADLDQDGVPEIIASADSNDDALTVW